MSIWEWANERRAVLQDAPIGDQIKCGPIGQSVYAGLCCGPNYELVPPDGWAIESVKTTESWVLKMHVALRRERTPINVTRHTIVNNTNVTTYIKFGPREES